MGKIRKLASIFNFKTVYFNFKYLPFRQAVRFPFLISGKVSLRTMQGKIRLECPVSFGLIRIGLGDVGIFDNRRSRSIWDVSGTVVFKGKANIGHGSKISVGKSGILILGNNFNITAETSIVAHSQITFGNDCLLSWDTLIMDTDFHAITDSSNTVINGDQPIYIGNKVWIGCRNLILKGSVIPDNSIVGANSLVSRVLEKENCLYAGNPIKCIKEDVNWEI